MRSELKVVKKNGEKLFQVSLTLEGKTTELVVDSLPAHIIKGGSILTVERNGREIGSAMAEDPSAFHMPQSFTNLQGIFNEKGDEIIPKEDVLDLLDNPAFSWNEQEGLVLDLTQDDDQDPVDIDSFMEEVRKEVQAYEKAEPDLSGKRGMFSHIASIKPEEISELQPGDTVIFEGFGSITGVIDKKLKQVEGSLESILFLADRNKDQDGIIRFEDP